MFYLHFLHLSISISTSPSLSLALSSFFPLIFFRFLSPSLSLSLYKQENKHTNASPKITINGFYKPCPNGRFSIVFATSNIFILFMAKKSACSPAIHRPCLTKHRRHRGWRALGPYPPRCSPTWRSLRFDAGKRFQLQKSMSFRGFIPKQGKGTAKVLGFQASLLLKMGLLNYAYQDAKLRMPWETNMEPQSCNVTMSNQFEVPW